MWLTLAAELPPAPTPPDRTSAYLVFIAGVLATLASIAIAIINRPGRTSPSPPAPAEDDLTGKIRERVATVEANWSGTDKALGDLEDDFDIADRRLAKVEVWVDDHEARLRRLERRAGDAE